jgi:hypothetical protein
MVSRRFSWGFGRGRRRMDFYQNTMGAFITNPENPSNVKKTEIDKTGHSIRASAETSFDCLTGESE